MKMLVTGVGGQLGWDVCRRLDALGIENKGVDVQDFDLTDAAAVEAAVRAYGPDCVIHCAAYTAVDRAEAEPALCMAINEGGTRSLARACADIGASMLYVSTDYVFSGTGDAPFQVDDPKDPQSVYGRSKLAGEQAVLELLPERAFIVRISWVFGINGHNFVRTIRRLAGERESLTVVADQIGSPTYTPDLAVLLCGMAQTTRYGVYHASNEGFCSWYDFAREIVAKSGLACDVKPITTAEYPTPAARPLNSRMSKESLDQGGFARLPAWQDALERYLAVLDAEG